MTITVHRGTKEIGGSCIEVSTEATRIILDVGLPLVNANRKPFDSTTALKKTTEELLKDGTIPKVPGLFGDDAKSPDAILLSHAHLDHMGLIHRSRAVPVYATRGTSKMMLAGSIFARRPDLERARHWEIKAEKSFKIGDFTITPFAVDHSTFACLAFQIEAEGKRILYTGDFRNHGRKPGMLPKLLKAVKDKPIDVLLTEGTHLGRDKEAEQTEHELERKIVDSIRKAPSLVLACFSPQDVDRLVTLYRSAVRSGRIFVVDAYAALILHLVQSEAKIPAPKRQHGIRVYFNASFRRKRNAKLNRLFGPHRITLKEVLKEPAKHLMVFRPSMTKPDFGGELPEQVLVLYCYWLGYLKNADWVELKQQVKATSGTFILAHASGHVYIKDLIPFIRKVNARSIVPIHTFEPGVLAESFASVHRLKDGQPWEIP